MEFGEKLDITGTIFFLLVFWGKIFTVSICDLLATNSSSTTSTAILGSSMFVSACEGQCHLLSDVILCHDNNMSIM